MNNNEIMKPYDICVHFTFFIYRYIYKTNTQWVDNPQFTGRKKKEISYSKQNFEDDVNTTKIIPRAVYNYFESLDLLGIIFPKTLSKLVWTNKKWI